ncbi:hypothetical protein VIGAN_02183500 [Vigna angularis var. angularis]|uniref:Uncharacterized protein n=1 Tax=Vigna angularis var. angularis TaxID=157739 RepID=A0A0S3REW1_PHAAN|nr:hypothetical protein VIGAN_02183500 [Vigna angularis var. angularis]
MKRCTKPNEKTRTSSNIILHSSSDLFSSSSHHPLELTASFSLLEPHAPNSEIFCGALKENRGLLLFSTASLLQIIASFGCAKNHEGVLQAILP